MKTVIRTVLIAVSSLAVLATPAVAAPVVKADTIGAPGVGDPFFPLAAEHRYGNVSTPEFIALAEQVSGQDLGGFFNSWLYQSGKPDLLGKGASDPFSAG